MTGVVFDIARFSLHDGPGIRTAVFLKGCPLRCAWCQNPESQALEPELFVEPEKCAGCGACRTVGCAAGLDRSLCTNCGRCAAVCNFGARRMIGRRMNAGEVWAAVRRDAPFYGASGGMTLTGGEPLFQFDFAMELLKLSAAERIGSVVETCGELPVEHLLSAAEYAGLFYYDLKTADPELHRKLTGRDNRRIIENLERLAAAGARIQVRCPVIPGCNDAPSELAAVRRIAAGFGLGEVEFLPFNPAAAAKYSGLGRSYSPEDAAAFSRTAEPSGAVLTGPLSSPNRTDGSSGMPE